MPIASRKPDSRMSVESSSFDAASTSQVRFKGCIPWRVDGRAAVRTPSHRRRRRSRSNSDNPAAGTWYYKGESVSQDNTAWRNPFAHGASSSVDQESQKEYGSDMGPLSLTYRQTHRTAWKPSSSMVRKICGKQPGDPMEDLNVTLAIWWIFMNTTLRAAVHLGEDYDMNLRFVKNHLWKTTGTAFQWNRKADQSSDRNHWQSMITFQDLRWVSTSLLHSRAYQMPLPRSISTLTLCSAWEKGRQSYWILEEANSMVFAEQPLQGIESRRWHADGVRVEIFTGFTTLGILEEIQKFMKSRECEPEHFNGRLIFMFMYRDIVWRGETETQKNVIRILLKFRSMLAGFLAVVGHAWDLDQKRNGTRTVLINQTEIGTELQKWWYSN